MLSAFSLIVRLAWDLLQWHGLLLRPSESLEAEVLFLRRQLALYRELIELHSRRLIHFNVTAHPPTCSVGSRRS